MKRLLAILLFACTIPAFAAIPTVTVQVNCVSPDGSFPATAPYSSCMVTYQAAGNPAVTTYAVGASYDSTTGVLSWTVPANSQISVMVSNVLGFSVAQTYSVGTTSPLVLNDQIPVSVPATAPAWASDLPHYPTPDAAGWWHSDGAGGYAWSTPTASDVGAIGAPASPAQGDLLYYSGTQWVSLSPGTSGDALTTQGAGADPVWSSVSATPGGSPGQLQINNSGSFSGVPGTSVDASTGAVTLTAGSSSTTPLTIISQPGAISPSFTIQQGNGGTLGVADVGLVTPAFVSNSHIYFQAGSQYIVFTSATGSPTLQIQASSAGNVSQIRFLTSSTNQIITMAGGLTIAPFSGLTSIIGGITASGTVSAASVSAPDVPTISSGVGAPSTTPAKVGDIYVDTTAVKIYVSTGTSSSADWTAVN